MKRADKYYTLGKIIFRFMLLVQTVLVVLKVSGYLRCNWLIIAAPMWSPFFVFGVYILAWFIYFSHSKKYRK